MLLRAELATLREARSELQQARERIAALESELARVRGEIQGELKRRAQESPIDRLHNLCRGLEQPLPVTCPFCNQSFTHDSSKDPAGAPTPAEPAPPTLRRCGGCSNPPDERRWLDIFEKSLCARCVGVDDGGPSPGKAPRGEVG